MNPTVGRIVYYRLDNNDAEAINRRRTTGNSIAERIAAGQWPIGAQAHIGNSVSAGDVFPAIVVRVLPNDNLNLKVMLDGSDDYWATTRPQSLEPEPQMGTWNWPPRS